MRAKKMCRPAATPTHAGDPAGLTAEEQWRPFGPKVFGQILLVECRSLYGAAPRHSLISLADCRAFRNPSVAARSSHWMWQLVRLLKLRQSLAHRVIAATGECGLMLNLVSRRVLAEYRAGRRVTVPACELRLGLAPN